MELFDSGSFVFGAVDLRGLRRFATDFFAGDFFVNIVFFFGAAFFFFFELADDFRVVVFFFFRADVFFLVFAAVPPLAFFTVFDFFFVLVADFLLVLVEVFFFAMLPIPHSIETPPSSPAEHRRSAVILAAFEADGSRRKQAAGD